MKRKILVLIMCFIVMAQTLWAKPIPELSAEGILLIEPKTNTVLVSRNANQKFYPASITKVLTSYILIQEMNRQKIITKSQNSIQTVPSDSSHIGLAVGDQYSYENGLYGIMLGSDNFIAHDMARANSGSISAFATKMNEVAEQMGAKNSHFVNPHGYHDANHYTTPYDMAQIARVAFADPTLQKIAGTSSYQFKVKSSHKTIPIKNSAKVIQKDSQYYNSHIVSVKTGYHSKAQQTIVAMAQYPDISLIAVVMKTNRPNQYTDLGKLFEYGATNFSVEKKSDGTFKLINHTASDWAKPYIASATEKGWIEGGGTNYQQPLSGGELKVILNKALNTEQITQIGQEVERCSKLKQITRKEFGELIGVLSADQANRLKTVEGDRAITYEEVVCIVYRLII